MKKSRILILLTGVVLALLSTTGLAKKASADEKAKNDFTDPNKVIQVNSKSPVITLKIKSNPTTGYSWFLTDDFRSDLIQPIGQKFYPGDVKKPGAPGYEVWRFKVKSSAFVVPRITNITLHYVRPWVVTNNGRKMTFVVVVK